ncbi:E3 ubiquitin-protein ligase TRIM39-like [Trichomycterus rosablanca]|uniref:E3 ubiquitin-protein ligase TRIM39-like n=1 Tax=Trichomycterus rosablanca TaxID=2290929 RepID=UPI002F35293B
MASSSSFLSEDQLQCSICLDVFTDPVSTPCGHNFCMTCLKECWDTSSHCRCPLCKEEFPQRPELRVNTFISGLVAQLMDPVQVKSSSTAEDPTAYLVLCDICSKKKREALKSCLICVASYCKTHLEPHQRVPLLKKHKLIDSVENLEDYICQKHEKLLEMFCRDDQTCVCQFCTETDHKNHNTVPIEEESAEKKNELVRNHAKVEQMIRDRLKKIDKIKCSVKINKKNAEQETTEHVEIFKALINVMQENQRAAERQAKEFIKDLEQDITELMRRNTELEQISNTEDHLHLLQIYPSLCRPPPTNNWTDVSIQSHLDVETLKRALSQLQECIDDEMKKVVSMELQRIQQHAVDVNLDPDTANSYLILSDDGKQVTCGDTKQDLPDNPERFDYCPCVLGKEGFSSGRFYYEVQVKGKTEWDLGVTRESSNRKGGIKPNPTDGYWFVCLRNKTAYLALDSPRDSLSLKQAPEKVGVFVDYEEGLVSFYDVENESHIYSFTGQSFTGKLYPLFKPGRNCGGKNSAPLIICPVSQVQSQLVNVMQRCCLSLFIFFLLYFFLSIILRMDFCAYVPHFLRYHH